MQSHPRLAVTFSALLFAFTHQIFGQHIVQTVTTTTHPQAAALEQGNQNPELGGTTPAALQFVPVTPCRVADTRSPAGPFGGPELAAASTRNFNVTESACNIPTTAVAYSLNVTVVPKASLNYLTLWPTGQAQPTVSTLNSDGRIKANAAIVLAGTGGGVSVFVTDTTQVILDIDGYFVPAGTTGGLAFYPVTPCRVADTRNANAPLGGPFLGAQSSRSFPVQSSACNLPSSAQAYSLNVTALPHTTLDYLTLWPAGETQPYVSTLNALTGQITANAAIVPAGNGGAVSVFVYNDADVVLDVNGYFAPPGNGGLSFYSTTPCRVLDTRPKAFNGTLPVAVETGACPSPGTAQAYVLNSTVVPPAALTYLTLWPNQETQPFVSTLNSLDGSIASNLAIVPTANGSIDAFGSSSTNLILDTSGYFAGPSTVTVPNGTYAFVFAGTGPQGSPSAENGIAVTGTFSVQNGSVLSGFYDENTNTGGVTATELPITGGSISASANGLGSLTLNTAAGTQTYSIAIPANVAAGASGAIHIIRFDDATGTGVRGSGIIKPAAPVATTAAISGSYAFLLSGSDHNQVQEALAGSFATNGSGTIASGRADANQQGGSVIAFPSLTGSYAVDANGHGLYHLRLGATTFNYSFYEVSPAEWLSISIDPVSGNAPLVSGSVLKQSGPFSVASIPSSSVLEISGLQGSTGNKVPYITEGIATSNGAGTVTYTFDNFSGSILPNQSFSVTYQVDAATGRAASGTQPILYLVDSSRAFLLGTDAPASSGMLETQAGAPYTNASLNGNFLGGSQPSVDTSVLNEVGSIVADGNGNIQFTTNRSTPAGLTPNQTISGTYTVSSSGRVVVNTSDGVTRFFYLVSPRKFAYLTSDQGGYRGSFQQ